MTPQYPYLAGLGAFELVMVLALAFVMVAIVLAAFRRSKDRGLVALGLVALAFVLLVSTGCTPTAPTNVTVINTNQNTNSGGGGNPSASPSPSAGGDNDVSGFAIFCYGFGAQPGQPEPNHGTCALPTGYPEVAVTASPKNKAGVDIPNPGDKTSTEVINWQLAVSPPGAATLVIQADNRFNASVQPASPRTAASFTVVAFYKDPKGGSWTASKAGAIQ